MKISKELKITIVDLVSKLNTKLFDDEGDGYFTTRTSGKFLYLDFVEHNRSEKRCRLSYSGDMNAWEFSIFKWSSEKFSVSDDFDMFDGCEYLDGTIEGAMKAGYIAYR